MLIDEVDVVIEGGKGGDGKVSFGLNGPDGGNGGKGGNVYLRSTTDLRALNQFSAYKKVKAGDGDDGKYRNLEGKKGLDIYIDIPVGTEILDLDTKEVINIDQKGWEMLFCNGGRGGWGNWKFKSSKNRSPQKAMPGKLGDRKNIRFTLKYLAQHGLVGLPNAGKSSLLNAMTGAKSAVGAYPFTTLEAHLGVFSDKVIADIPGLIEGASHGKGLGIRFLKHIEKVTIIVQCISLESEDVMRDFETINNELVSYGRGLALKKRVLLLTKTDLGLEDELMTKMEILKKNTKYDVLSVSVFDKPSIEMLKNYLLDH